MSPQPRDTVREEVVRFWLAESALPDLAAAQARAHQLLVVARDPDGQVAGVSTAVPTDVDRLGLKCFFYRTFVGRAHRARGLRSTELVWKILRESYRLLNERFRQGCDPDILGIYAEIDNPTIMRVRNDTVWQESCMNFLFSLAGHVKDSMYVCGTSTARGFHEMPSIGHVKHVT